MALGIYYDDIRAGWPTFVEQLRFMIERHPGDDRTFLCQELPSQAGHPPRSFLG